MDNSGYVCKECGSPLIVRGEDLIRTCEHKGTIVMEMSAVTKGVSKTGAQ